MSSAEKVDMPKEQRRGSVDYWNGTGRYGMTTTRSPPHSPRSNSFAAPTGLAARRHSSITPEMIEKMAQRRASLDKLNVDKVAPWMYLYDFQDKEETSE